MKAFHFVLTTGERGTLAGCADDMTIEQAADALSFQFPDRLEEVVKAGTFTSAMLKHPMIEPLSMTDPTNGQFFDGGICQPGPQDGPLLFLERLQNIPRRQKGESI